MTNKNERCFLLRYVAKMGRLSLILANGFVKLKTQHHTYNILAAKCLAAKDFEFTPVAYDWGKMNSAEYNKTYFALRDQYRQKITDFPSLLSIGNLDDANRDFSYKRDMMFTIGCSSGRRYTRMQFLFDRDQFVVDQSMACIPDVSAELRFPISKNEAVLRDMLSYSLVHMKRETGPALV